LKVFIFYRFKCGLFCVFVSILLFEKEIAYSGKPAGAAVGFSCHTNISSVKDKPVMGIGEHFGRKMLHQLFFAAKGIL
jgi:hypothetical protein